MYAKGITTIETPHTRHNIKNIITCLILTQIEDYNTKYADLRCLNLKRNETCIEMYTYHEYDENSDRLYVEKLLILLPGLDREHCHKNVIVLSGEQIKDEKEVYLTNK